MTTHRLACGRPCHARSGKTKTEVEHCAHICAILDHSPVMNDASSDTRNAASFATSSASASRPKEFLPYPRQCSLAFDGLLQRHAPTLDLLQSCLSTIRRADLSVCRCLRPSDALAGDSGPSAKSGQPGRMRTATERLTQRSVYSAGCVGVDGDAVLPVVDRRTLRQAADPELARTVCCLLRTTWS